MKKIEFKRLYIQNFLSVGNEPLEINFSSGMNVITGINNDENGIANGCGKSLIIDGFYFAIFGSAMRELPKLTYIVNRQNGSKCCVRLESDIVESGNKSNYIIERKIAPQSLKIWKDGKEITKSTTAETNKFIIDLFGADNEIFQNCITMRANNNASLMSKKKADKKGFMEGLLNLEVFSRMVKQLRDDIRNSKNQFNIEQKALSVYENTINNYRERLNSVKKEVEKTETDKLKEKENILKKLNNEQLKRNELEKEYSLYCRDIVSEKRDFENQKSSCNATLKKLIAIQNKIRVDQGIANRDIKNLEEHGNICPTCKREYPEEHIKDIDLKKQTLYNNLNLYNTQLDALSGKIKELEAGINDIISKISDLNAYQIKKESIYKSIQDCGRFINMYQEQLNTFLDKVDTSVIQTYQDLINDAEAAAKIVKSTLSDLESELAKLNACEHILGEYGVRNYVVNKLLLTFNERVNYYLRAIKSTFSFEFNEQFEDKIIDSNGLICTYNNCSGAESKKIDIAVSFAIMDMLFLQKQVSYNLLFFDEILDSSLDDKSLGIILDFISEHSYKTNKGIYIISHKSGVQIPDINEVIMVEKTGGFSKRGDAS